MKLKREASGAARIELTAKEFTALQSAIDKVVRRDAFHDLIGPREANVLFDLDDLLQGNTR